MLTATAGASLALAPWLAIPALAQGKVSRDQPAAVVTPADERPTMRAYPLDEPLTIDGRLDEEAWSRYPSAAGFIQKEPVEGAPAINDSEVWVFYDPGAIYVGAILHDETPWAIPAGLARRDAPYGGQFDYFEVMFDPNLDRLTGYRFRTTSANVQTDRYLFNDGGEDANWDAVWESAVTIDERGWIVEMRIPLSQMRYESSADPQTWGINFGRRRSQDNELTRFALESKLVPGRVSQFGHVEGVVAEKSRRLEMRPYVVTSAHVGTAQEGDPFFDGSELDGRVGVDLRYGIGTNFTLDATFNPDFGQVESDPAVINLSAFEVFFEERRPFFVEDARVFDFRISGGASDLFYTRRVGREPQGRSPSEASFTDVPEATTILGAAKLTGRTAGGLSLGALAAVTSKETGRAYFPDGEVIESFPVQPRVGHAVLRLQQDMRQGATSVGGMVTYLNRALPSDGTFDYLTADALTGGLDFEHYWGDRNWRLWGFGTYSHIQGDSTAMIRVQRASNHFRQRPDNEFNPIDSTATALNGGEWRLQLEKARGKWTGALWTAQIGSGYEINDLGFRTSMERLDGGARVAFQEVTPGTIFRNYSVSLSTFHNLSHELLEGSLTWDRIRWAQTSGRVGLEANFVFNNFWGIQAEVDYVPERMSRTLTRGGPRMVSPAGAEWELEFNTDNRQVLSIRPSVAFSQRSQGDGSTLDARVPIVWQPSSQVQVQVSPGYGVGSTGSQYVFTSDALEYEPTLGDRYLFSDLDQTGFSMETRLNWTVSPTLSLQLWAQPLLSSGNYVTYKQLSLPETFDFDVFEEGVFEEAVDGVMCVGGRTCTDGEGTRYVDFDGNGAVDDSFQDQDFNVRSFRATAVLRWEYRPGSRLFFVWQRRQGERVNVGDFDFGRDLGAMFGAPGDDVFIIKADLWIPL
jgi:hypothetical protein